MRRSPLQQTTAGPAKLKSGTAVNATLVATSRPTDSPQPACSQHHHARPYDASLPAQCKCPRRHVAFDPFVE
ncbi:hypothetical protein GO497_03795 [Acidovorax citrulli]|nr:hypothetical protein [Paracidovorax citrulli]